MQQKNEPHTRNVRREPNPAREPQHTRDDAGDDSDGDTQEKEDGGQLRERILRERAGVSTVSVAPLLS